MTVRKLFSGPQLQLQLRQLSKIRCIVIDMGQVVGFDKRLEVYVEWWVVNIGQYMVDK